MCDPVTAAWAIGGALASQTLMAKQPSTPAPQAPSAPPQPTKQPDQAAARKNGGLGAATGQAGTGTMLTGAAGVDPASLALGKNTLLGA